MKPLVLDTSIWVEWLRGRTESIREKIRGRAVFLPSIVEMELLAGARDSKALVIINELLEPFSRNHRIILPDEKDFRKAGNLMARFSLRASLHSNDTLVVVCARKVGAELWTLNKKDFVSTCRALQVTLGPSD